MSRNGSAQHRFVLSGFFQQCSAVLNLPTKTLLQKGGRLIIAGCFCAISFQGMAQTDKGFRLLDLYEDEGHTLFALINPLSPTITSSSTFHLMEDTALTVPQTQVARLQDSDWSLQLLICMDTSGSLKNGPIEEIKSALQVLLSGGLLRQTDELALRTFDDETQLLWWFDDNNRRIQDAIATIDGRGSWTSLYEAVLAGISDFMVYSQSASAPVKVVKRLLIISDGKNERPNTPDIAENTSLERIRTLAKRNHIAIDFLATVPQDQVNENFREGYVQQLRSLSESTGGFTVYAEQGQIAVSLDRLMNQILSSLVLTFERRTLNANANEDNANVAYTYHVGLSVNQWKQELPMRIMASQSLGFEKQGIGSPREALELGLSESQSPLVSEEVGNDEKRQENTFSESDENTSGIPLPIVIPLVILLLTTLMWLVLKQKKSRHTRRETVSWGGRSSSSQQTRGGPQTPVAPQSRPAHRATLVSTERDSRESVRDRRTVIQDDASS